MEEPIFVVGAERSGTTLMRLILNAHPVIAIPDETRYFPHVYEPFAARGPMLWPEAIDAFLAICGESLRPAVDLAEVTLRLQSLPAPDFAALLSLPLALWANAQGSARWGEKTPSHIFYADVIMSLFPAAKVIHIVRDPRAVVASMNRFDRLFTDDTVLNARYWHDVATRARDVLLNAVPEQQRMVVHYEDVVITPELVVRTVCDFLGEEFVASMLTFHETTTQYIGTVHSPKLLSPLTASEWQSKISLRDLAFIEAICGNEMEELGYKREGRTLRPAERVELATKLTYVAVKQRQHRHERYHRVTYSPLGRLRTIGSGIGARLSGRPTRDSRPSDDDPVKAAER